MRSVSCQSGPCSRMTTFLPAFASTAAKTDPDAPAPTMTTSTFSLAMSPPLGRSDVGHVRNAEAGIALHGAVDDVDGIATQDQVDEWSTRPLPAFDLVLAHVVDEAALLGFAELCKRPAVVERLASAIDRAQRRAIEIHVGRAHVEDARFEQRLLRRDRDLLIDEVGYPGLARTRDERLAERVEGGRLRGRQRPQRNALCTRRARREQNLGAAHREGERTDGRALHEGASFDVVHGSPPRHPIRVHSSSATIAARSVEPIPWRRPLSSGMVPKFNADFGSESSGLARRRRGAYSTLPPNNRSALP